MTDDEPQPIPQSGRVDDEHLPTEILLVRHGESAAIVPDTPGSDDPPLSERGEEQAAAVAARLAAVAIDAVYSSDYARAKQTAAAIAAPHGLTVVEKPEIREVHLGEWNEGGFRKRAATRDDPHFLAFMETGRWEVIPGAEADDALRARMVAAVTEIARAHPGGRAVAVCHGGSINAWLADRFGSQRSMVVSIDNTSITRLRTDATNWLVRSVNDVHHLSHGQL